MNSGRLSDRLKEHLIRKSLHRKQQQESRLVREDSEEMRAPSTKPVSHANLAQFTDFTRHPSYQQLEMLREGGRRLNLSDPFFRVHEGCAGATTRIDGRSVINFSNYNYLGLCGHPDINRAAREAIEQYGTSVSASRIVSGERPIHNQLERELAALYEVDAAVAFVSGHATNVSTLGHLLGPGDLVIHDELIHNSLLVGARLSGATRMGFAHNDLQVLERLLVQHRPRFQRTVIVVEGLYSMDGDFPDLPALLHLKERHQAWLMVDEAHSFGVMGETGRGIREYFGVAGSDVDIWMGTLSKSFAACGGYIAGSQALVDILRNFAPGFLYSVGMPGQVAAPALAALQLMQAEPERVERLHARSRLFLELARKHGLQTGPYCAGYAVVPVITGDSIKAVRWSSELFNAGINVQPILYPAVQEKNARLRFFISADHTEPQIRETVECLADIAAR